METIFVYMTASSPEEARRLGRALVDERLAACVNLFEGMTSIYSWKGQVEEGGEVAMIAKTRADLFEPLARRVRELHSYECPCIVSLPVTKGDPGFLSWIAEQTA